MSHLKIDSTESIFHQSKTLNKKYQLSLNRCNKNINNHGSPGLKSTRGNEEAGAKLANENKGIYKCPGSESTFGAGSSMYGSQNFRLRLSESCLTNDSDESVTREEIRHDDNIESAKKYSIIELSDSSNDSILDSPEWKKIYSGSLVQKSYTKSETNRKSVYIIDSSDDDDDLREFRSKKSLENCRIDDAFEKLKNSGPYKKNGSGNHSSFEDISPSIDEGNNRKNSRISLDDTFDKLKNSDLYKNNESSTCSSFENINEKNNEENYSHSRSGSSTHVSRTQELEDPTKCKKYDASWKTCGTVGDALKSAGIPIDSTPKVRSNNSLLVKSGRSGNTTKERNKLTKIQAYNILKIIKSKKAVYYSPKDRRENRKAADRSVEESGYPLDLSEDESNHEQENTDKGKATVINETESENEEIVLQPESDTRKPQKTHVSRFLNDGLMLFELSERKKKDISEWILNNTAGSASDSSCDHVSESNRNSVSSGNSSLERFEMNHETPNNRGKLSKVNTAEKKIADPDATTAVQSVLNRQTTLDKFFEIPKRGVQDLRTPKRTTNKPISEKKDRKPNQSTPPATSEPKENSAMKDCEKILDNLYGKDWRAKANAVLPISEPRKQIVAKKDRGVQTERKPKLKSNGDARATVYSDFDDDSFDEFIQKRKPLLNSTTKPQPESKKVADSFINDELASESNNSTYYTALTNPRVSKTPSVGVRKTTAISAAVERALMICDSESDKESNRGLVNKTTSNRRRLSYSDDESDSSTSEFDPGEVIPPKSTIKKGPGKTSRTVQGPPKLSATKFVNPVRQKSKSFLASLSANVPLADAHPDAKIYRTNYKKNKEDLCKYLFKMYNREIFDNKLPDDMTIEWNVRMRGTAGFCYNKESVKTLGGVTRSSRIVLAQKILDTPDRLRDTLIHEMCHAAAWLINNVSDGHGPFWKGWAGKAIKRFPELPPISRCHDYKISTKFTYRCTSCSYSIGRHSKSLDIERKRCGYCFGKFELLVNRNAKSGTVQVQTPLRAKQPSGFALFVKDNYHSVKKTRRSIKHGEVMKILGQQFSAVKISKQANDAKDA